MSHTTLFYEALRLVPEAFAPTAYEYEDIFLIPMALTEMRCEACESRETLTERRWHDEDGDAYYNVLCGSCRGEEAL